MSKKLTVEQLEGEHLHIDRKRTTKEANIVAELKPQSQKRLKVSTVQLMETKLMKPNLTKQKDDIVSSFKKLSIHERANPEDATPVSQKGRRFSMTKPTRDDTNLFNEESLVA